MLVLPTCLVFDTLPALAALAKEKNTNSDEGSVCF